MGTRLEDPVAYSLNLEGEELNLNSLLEKRLSISHTGQINCLYCGRKTNKSFSQGYCYPCFTRLPQCDTCIMSPERCHFFQGTCRDEDWGRAHCFTPHVVYLANASHLKVGITRATQLPVRWIDQGASMALPVFEVANRRQSGLLEQLFKSQVSDRTHWQKMLKGEAEPLDLIAEKQCLLTHFSDAVQTLTDQHAGVRVLDDAAVVNIHYPVKLYPQKIKAHNLDKTPRVEGVLLGIKGQYLILDTGVLNMRKFTSYRIRLETE